MKHRTVAIALAVALTVAACGGGGSEPDAESPAATADSQVESAETAPPATVGDSLPDGTLPTDATDGPRCADIGDGAFAEVGCAEPHDAEFLGLIDAPDGPIPDPPDNGDADRDALDEPGAILDLRVATSCYDLALGVLGGIEGDFPMDLTSPSVAEAGYPDQIECWLSMSAPDSLTASVAADGLAAALGDAVLLGSLEPGTCYRLLDEESFDVVEVVDCADESAEEMLVGFFDLASVEVFGADFPGQQMVIDAAFDGCDPVVEDAGIDPQTVAIVYPGRTLNWEVLRQRTVKCVSILASADGDEEEASAPYELPYCLKTSISADPVPCDQPHDAEYVTTLPTPDGTVPFDDGEEATAAYRLCADVVEEYVGEPREQWGYKVSWIVDGEPGEPYTSGIECFASVSTPDGLTSSLADVDLRSALSDGLLIITDLDAGQCFTFGPDTVAFVVITECGAQDALMYIGSFESDTVDYPGLDAAREERSVRCADLLADLDLAVDADSLSGSIPGADAWNAFGRRVITCDASPR